MKIQLNTDKHIEGHQRLENYVNEKVMQSLQRFNERITRVEIHLADLNGEKKSKQDIQCIMEARLEGLKPMAVTSKEGDIEKALNSAIQKLKNLMESTLGKLEKVNH
jgi:hypothetical protein